LKTSNFKFLQHSYRKKFPNSTIAVYISLSTKLRKQAGKILWNRIWQTWVFSLCRLHSSAAIHLAKFEAYPSRNFTELIKSQNSFCFILESTYGASGILHDSLSSVATMCRFDLTPIYSKSTTSLMVSYVFPTILSNVPIRFSHMFFSMCISSRLCANFRDDQYGKSHKQTLRLQHYPDSRFLFFPWGRGCFPSLTSLTFSSCCFSSSWVNCSSFLGFL
jgi:hypothetical protein